MGHIYFALSSYKLQRPDRHMCRVSVPPLVLFSLNSDVLDPRKSNVNKLFPPVVCHYAIAWYFNPIVNLITPVCRKGKKMEVGR